MLRLVEITDDIRRERKERLREIQFERDREMGPGPPPMPRIPPPPMRGGYGDYESIHERDYEYRKRYGR